MSEENEVNIETISMTRADEVMLGDRLHVPGTSITFPVRFIHRRLGMVLFELSSGATMQRKAGQTVRVVRRS